MKAIFLPFAVLFLVDKVTSSNILVIAFVSTKSNKITYLPLVEELGKRGHNITLVSPIKPLGGEMKNVREIYTLDIEALFNEERYSAFEMKEKGISADPLKFLRLAEKTCTSSYNLPQVKALLNEKFDLILFPPIMNECLAGLVYRLEAPFVLFTQTVVPNFVAHKIGGYFPSSIIPNIILGYPQKMSFLQRVRNFGTNMISEIYFKYLHEPRMENIYRRYLGRDIPAVNEIFANASLLLSNGHFTLTEPKPYMPDIIDVGGIHSRPAKQLPKNLEDFIQKGQDGFIVFSMGTATKGDTMPEYKRKLILKVFSKLKQRVFWKWESETMPDLPENVMLSKWLPIQDLLGHKDIRLFITHCGCGSIEEAIYHGVPLVGLPMIADQPQNSAFAKRHEILFELSWNDLTEDLFLQGIQQVLNNPKYRDNVKKLSTLFKDRPVDPLELGVYWIEYVLRHKGAPHLRSKPARTMNAIQYHSLDVIGAYLLILLVILISSIKTVKFATRKLFEKNLKYSKTNS